VFGPGWLRTTTAACACGTPDTTAPPGGSWPRPVHRGRRGSASALRSTPGSRVTVTPVESSPRAWWRRPRGGLLAYAGFDGEVTRLHMATSTDGRRWSPTGPSCSAGPRTASRPRTRAWWVPANGGAVLLRLRRLAQPPPVGGTGGLSPSGASWDRLGVVLEPPDDELAVFHPCVLEITGTLYMFSASDPGTRSGSPWRPRRIACPGDRRA
jgi:hypothetical protein